MLGRPALPRELQRRFWLMMRTGVVLDDAAATVGVSKAVAWRWFREAGGVCSLLLPPVISNLLHGRSDCHSRSVKRSAFYEPPARVSGPSRGD